jgi:hypothetical protein
VKIKASFKRDDKHFDGLSAIEAKLVDEDLMHERYLVVAIVQPHRIDVLAEDGVKSATVKFTHIEVVEGDVAAEVKERLMAVYRDRTGRDDEPAPTLFDDPDGQRQVPEASAKEIMAGRAEAKARGEG